MTGRHGRAALLSLALLRAAPLCFAAPPLPNERQLQFMEMEFVQFMHFGVDTAWLPSDDFLRSAIPTYHNCNARFTGTSHDYQTEGTWPCLNASIFNPAALDTEGWMEAATALGVKEICLTAKHAGGFTLWPSQFTPYGVHAARGYRGGKGDVLKEFVASAKRWGIKVCYYMNPLTDGYLTQVEGVDAQEYARRELGMLTELLHPGSPYGPVHRLWFDGVLSGPFRPPPLDTNYTEYYDSVYRLVRSTSPDTLISPYRGDVCSSIGSLYTSGGPAPNSTNSSMCAPPSETGTYFHPTEMHGITMQEGPDGNTDAFPTYWFWHTRRVCASNATSCPWIGHSNASRMFDGYIATVGHGGVLNSNIAPMANGKLNDSVVEVMRATGKAINDTFFLHNAGKAVQVSAKCAVGVATVNVTGDFDYIVSMEDLTKGQRIGNYSLEYRLQGTDAWHTLVPPVQPPADNRAAVGDRPDGHDPRDQYVGHKRIDTPAVAVAGESIAQVRFNCIRVVESVDAGDEMVHLRQFSLHKRRVPWSE